MSRDHDGDQDERSWFGPKRVGFGIRPQTSQGWLVMLLFVAGLILLVFVLVVVISLVTLARH